MSKKNDSQWADAVRQVNDPPAVPRDRMWQAIDASRREKRQVVTAPEFQQRRRGPARFWRVAVATAAVLVLGVAVGRMTVKPDAPVVVHTGTEVLGPPATTFNPVAEQKVYRLAAADLFGRADFLLTDFQVRSCTQQDLAQVPDWAGGMLLQTRLLLDTPVAQDADMQQLLEELELVLAQIVGLSRTNCAQDMAWIREGLQERSTLSRLRLMSDDVQGAI